jgi:heme A synthase
LEWFHRLLALLLVATLLALVAQAARLSGKLCVYCATSLLLVVATAVLGGLAVLHGESIALAAFGQALAMLSFASLVGLTVWAHIAAPAGKRT